MRFAILGLTSIVCLGGCSLIVEEAASDDTSSETGPGSDDTNPSTDDPDTGVSTSHNTDSFDTGVQTSENTDETGQSTADTGSTDEPVEVGGMLINNGAKFTNNPNVMLTFNVKNATKMRLYNENEPPLDKWQPFKTPYPWTIPAIDGERRVFADFMNDISGPVTTKGSIILDRMPPQTPFVERVGAYYTVDQTPEFRWQPKGEGNGQFRWVVDAVDFSQNPNLTTAYATETKTLSEGYHVFYVQERDEAGNWSGTASADVHIDRSGPTIHSFTFSQSDTGKACLYALQSSGYLNIAADDGASGVKELRVRIPPNNWIDSWTWFATQVPWSPPAQYGRVVVELEVRDELLNTSMASLNVIRDDQFEGCNGNDSIETAYDTMLELAGHLGPILDGSAFLGDGSDFYKVSLEEGSGGYVRVTCPNGDTTKLKLKILDSSSALLVAGSIRNNYIEAYLGGMPGEVCHDGKTTYYIQVQSTSSLPENLVYDLGFENIPDACP
jgi:hypothetical protein